MGRQRSPNRDAALNIFLEHNGRITTKEIAEKLNDKITNVNTWKTADKWEEKLNGKVGAPYGNTNAVGNKGGGAPLQNRNHYIHGFYSKYLPKKTYNIMKDMENMNGLERIQLKIGMLDAAIVESMKILHVKGPKDITKILKKSKGIMIGEGDNAKIVNTEEEYIVKLAEEKQVSALNAQSSAMVRLANLIKQYEDLINKNNSLVTEEQKLRIEKLKRDLKKDNDDTKNISINFNIPRPKVDSDGD